MSAEPADAPDVAGAAAPEVSPLRQALATFFESPLAAGGAVVSIAILLMAAAAPLISPQNPYDLGQIDILDGLLPPGAASGAGGAYWLGTDDQGRDMLSAILYGLRLSISVGIGSALLAVAMGTVVGLASAFFGGRFDSVIMRTVDVQVSFPTVLIALILLSVLGKGVDKVVLALVIVQWA
jgi:peptide/nickel transport system permease protein